MTLLASAQGSTRQVTASSRPRHSPCRSPDPSAALAFGAPVGIGSECLGGSQHSGRLQFTQATKLWLNAEATWGSWGTDDTGPWQPTAAVKYDGNYGASLDSTRRAN